MPEPPATAASDSQAGVARLDLAHGSGSTRIWIGPRAVTEGEREIAAWLAGRRVFVVSSAPVAALHRGRLDRLLPSAEDVTDLEVPDGEPAKTIETTERLLREMLRFGGKRDSRLISLGGGSVGDLGGFVAGCFLRGIAYAQFATTLLAQVDAAVGGKTAVNLPEAKNSVGLFHHPRWVVADTQFLETLPAEELRQALFEVVKVAILGDVELFELLESTLDDLLTGDPEHLSRVVRRAVAVKVRIVEQDEREADRRRLLNLGHTLGHALETTVGHGALRHGDAVGHGLLFAVALAKDRGLPAAAAERIRRLVGRLAPAPLPPVDRQAVLAALRIDKKARESGLWWVLPRDLGEVEVTAEVSESTVKNHLARFL